MSTRRAVDVFTPSDFPSVTYVARDDEQLERRLRDALETPGEVVSVSGPSKAGKTVLIEKVVGRDNLINITGAGIKDPGQIWDRVLDWMDVPQSSTTSSTLGATGEVSLRGSGELGMPLIARGTVEGGVSGGHSSEKTVEKTRARRGLSQVVAEIADSNFVLLIDDFHYMERENQIEVAKQVKEAARLRVKICTASVPHRSDDVVRSNPELRGRVRAIDLSYWKPGDLVQIAELGFPCLNVKLNSEAVHKFTIEASGSPQLMQAICLQACFELRIREGVLLERVFSLDDATVRRILEETATRTDFSSLVRNMHTGPKTRGTERKEFDFKDRTRGDVYRGVLLAIASDPPCLSFSYNELSKRIQSVCAADTPQAASVYQACSQISKMALDMYPNQRVVEWDEVDSVLDVVDPYFLFFIRWSGKLDSLSGDVR